MGFFHTKETASPAKRQGGRTAKADRDHSTWERGCDACSLKANWTWLKTPQMPISGNTKDPDILIIGEAPGEQEDRQGKAFVGESGQLLRKVIPGRAMHRIALQNTCRCRPRGNATPSARDAFACSVHLEADVAKYPIKAILGVGSVPLAQHFPGQQITVVHGIRIPVQIGAKVLWYFPVLHPAFVGRAGGEKGNLYPVFKSDVKRFFAEVDKWGKPSIFQPSPESVIVPKSIVEARDLEAKMSGVRAIDIETQKLRPYDRESALLTAAISDGNITIAFPIDHPEAPTEWGLRFLLEVASSRIWAAHNAIMELTWLLFAAEKAGIPFQPAVFEDSMACGRLYHERSGVLGLDRLSRIHLGCNVKALVNVNTNNMIAEPLDRILPYNGLDALASALIVNKLKPRVHKANYERLIGAIESTARMELMGLDVDEAINAALKEEWQGKVDRAQQASKKIYEVRQYERDKQVEFKIGSDKDIGAALVEYGKVDLPKTEGGGYKTDEATLLKAAPDNPLVINVLEYRGAKKNTSTYIDSVRKMIENNVDGRIHPSYGTMNVATGRLSSEDPNIQNYPKRDQENRELRAQVIAPPDHLLVAIDYGQLEARVLGCASRDNNLCTATIEKVDIHTKWLNKALELYPPYIDRLKRESNETDEKKILKSGRDTIKSDFVFASFYGSNAEACASRTGLPLVSTQELLRQFWTDPKEGYPDVLKWIRDRRREYQDTGAVSLLTGMVRRGIMGGNEPINTPIQGTAAHLVIEAQNALSRLSLEHKDPYLHPRINIHDDLTFVLPDEPELLETYIDIIAEQLVAIRHPWQIVPLAVEVKIGYNWADMEEIATIVGPYVR